jgi:hypothetical protein
MRAAPELAAVLRLRVTTPTLAGPSIAFDPKRWTLPIRTGLTGPSGKTLVTMPT